ncbi:MAG: hypothetical protein KDN18_11950 [Verrucomicrobiae bacterium]|nr:hypothetical protein [Verrucomicrobiae bacterium]
MKPLIRFLTILVLATGLASCVSVDENTAPTPALPTSGYDLGVMKGKQDGSSGLSRTPDRHAGSFAEADRSEFLRGYEEGYNAGIRGEKPASYGQPLTSVNGPGTVTIQEGARTVSVCKTASPNVEQTKFITEQQQIVVKSRGAHGPATVQLFDTATGTEKGRVMAYDIKNNQPAWAAGMGE